MRIGHIPSNAAQVARVSIESIIWELYELASESDWRNFKLIARARRPKANYWFGWNGTRFNGSADIYTLRQREPAVAAWLELALRDRRAACLIYGGEVSSLLDIS